jgi:iron complex outermembrane receptor protein
MRGLSAGSQPSQGSGSTGLWPNVAIYLDNQSGQLPNRNLDVYAADLNRIEVLEGPQGTLFGAGAEAGAIRYITNEPKLDTTEGSVKAGYGVTAHGDPNAERDGGVEPAADRRHPGRARGDLRRQPRRLYRQRTGDIHAQEHRRRHPLCELSGGQRTMGDGQPRRLCVPPGSPTVNNASRGRKRHQPRHLQGIRVEALYKINDDWNVLLTQSYQDMETQGVFYQQPNASDGAPLQPLEVTVFNPAYDKDRFESTAWTVNGKIGDLKAVYTGGYLVRNVEQVGDYTNYARGVYADYYQCYGPGTGYNTKLKSTCFSPSAFWRSIEKNEHQQHEFRLSTPDDWRARAIAGAYWEANKLFDQTDWNVQDVPACTSNGAGRYAGQ